MSVNSLLAHMRCHYAFGRLKGRRGMDACPLYLKGLTIRAVPDRRAVEITSAAPGAAAAIFERSRAHVVDREAAAGR